MSSYAPLPAACTAQRLSSHPPLWAACQRPSQATHRHRSRTAASARTAARCRLRQSQHRKQLPSAHLPLPALRCADAHHPDLRANPLHSGTADSMTVWHHALSVCHWHFILRCRCDGLLFGLRRHLIIKAIDGSTSRRALRSMPPVPSLTALSAEDFIRRHEHSNPHSPSLSLIASATLPRFPPLRIVQPLPIRLVALGQLRASRQASDNP